LPGDDPFYLSNTVDNDGRRGFYAVNAVPDLFFDGNAAITPGSYGSMEGAILPRLAVESPLEITVNTTVVGNSMTVEADITAVDDVPPSNLKVFVALVEPERHYSVSVGTNGEKDFYYIMRDMLPNYGGTAISMINGQTIQVSETGTLDPGWIDPYALVWVQDTSTKEVLQAAANDISVPNVFYYGAPAAAAMADIGELAAFPGKITNYGNNSDVYDFTIAKDLPTGWQSSVCSGDVCFSPFVTEFNVPLAPGEFEDILVDIQPVGTIGQGTVTLTATSRLDPTNVWTQTYKVISQGVPILCVDHDGGYDYETYYEAALDTGGYVYGSWNPASEGALAQADLSRFRVVIWNAGLSYPPVNAAERAAIAAYLEGGGNLFISGQDIGWDIFDPGGYSFSGEAQDWYHNYLGAHYITDDTADHTLTGVFGSPIGRDLSFNIEGGTGANNQAYPSEIDPWGDGFQCFKYEPGIQAGVHTEGPNWKSVYFAFGFEGIANVNGRNTIMRRVMDWFGPGVTGTEDSPPRLSSFATDPEAVPNPFNPSTRIDFVVDGLFRTDLSVKVYDLHGRHVRTLFEGKVMPGPQSLAWDGRGDDGAAVASGLYLAKIKLAKEERSLKMSLVK
jgi:hypothetical protein